MTFALVSTKEVKKHVAAIHIGGKLSLLQRKFYNILLYNAYDDLLKQERHEIKIRDLCELAGFDSNNHQVLKESLVSLSKTSVTWNVLDDDDVEEWGVSTMLSEAVIRKGVCTYAYAPSLREKLYKPELYARINLSVMSKFSGSYALALYENTIRFRGVGTTGWREVEVWRTILGIQEHEYKQFKELNKKVLKPAVKEVNATSDILLTMDFSREKRRITAIRFQIRDNPQMPIPFPIKERLIQQTREAERNEDQREVVVRLLTYGLSEAQARRVTGEYDAAYIEAVLAVVDRDFRAGKVENLPAYTVTALREDYRPKAPERQKQLADAKLVRRQERLVAERAEEAKERQKAQGTQELNAALIALAPAERAGLEREFAAAIADGSLPGATLLQGQFQTAGFESVIVQSMFRGFVRERLLAGKGAEKTTSPVDPEKSSVPET